MLTAPSSVAGATPSPSYGGRLLLVVRTRRNDTWVVPYKMGVGCTICPLRSLRSLHFYALWNLYTSCTRCIPGGLLCSLRRPLLHPTISTRCRRRVSGTGNQLAGCLPGRPESQHVVGCIKIRTHQRTNPKIPLLKVLEVLRDFSERSP